MKTNFTFWGAFLLLSFTAFVPVKAQEDSKVESGNLSTAKSVPGKLVFSGAAGLSVMNSDNRTQGYQSNTIGLMEGNGYGVNLGVGALYQFSPYLGLSGNLEYNRFKGLQDSGERIDISSFSYKSDVASVSASLLVNLGSKKAIARFYEQPDEQSLPLNNLSDFLRVIGKNTVVLPYLKAGVGLMHMNASSFVDGVREVSGTKFPVMAAMVPVGGGLRFRFSNQVSVAPEVTYNITVSDYFDNRKAPDGVLGKQDIFVSGAVKLFYTPSVKKKIKKTKTFHS
ncbi:outer membrane beta-barrel protein [Adhaeribacter aquaticus]|uniref:outer membrane beta-barrel protein n=1 Tax=Adhaeribacter aquaticus TaxID=299567 RepID=UPI00047C63C1|nr:outer membrane beta-barrel protein [Adhaeribacter aquaticus]